MLAKLEPAQDRIDSAFTWLEYDSRARIIIDTQLRIHWINGSASRMVSESSVLSIHNKMLRVLENRWFADFSAFIRAAGATESLLCVPQSSSEHILFTAFELNATATARIVGLTLRYTARSLLFDGAALEKAFHLTLTERRVVEALFAGRTAEQVGTNFRISIGTVRAHIRHIYEKLSVNSREALFARALPYFAPL